MKDAFKVVNQKSSHDADIYLYGNIGRYWKVDTEVLIPKLEALKADGLKNITFYVNSNGGEVPQGLLLFNYLKRNTFNVCFVVDGIAASMAAMLLFLPGAKVKVARYAKLMLHNVSGCACGTVSEIRSYADSMEDWQNDLIDIIARRTGMEKEKVTSKWFDEKDHWLNSSAALENKLIDEVIDGNPNIKAPENITNALEVMNHYENQLLNFNTNMKLTNDFAKLLNLSGSPDEDAILTAVRSAMGDLTQAREDLKAKDSEIATLKAKVAEHDKAKVKTLIDAAIASKKITEDMRDTYTNLAENNFDATKKVLDSMAEVTRVKNSLDQTKPGEDEKYKDYTFQDFQKKAPGVLSKMKDENPERYKALYKEFCGKEPVL